MSKRIAQIMIATIAAVTLASCIIISGDGEADFANETTQTQEN